MNEGPTARGRASAGPSSDDVAGVRAALAREGLTATDDEIALLAAATVRRREAFDAVRAWLARLGDEAT